MRYRHANAFTDLYPARLLTPVNCQATARP
jgi:hypothetical protein